MKIDARGSLSAEDRALLVAVRRAMGSKAPENWAREAKAAGIKGVSGSSLRRLKNDDPTRLEDETREGLKRFLSWRNAEAHGVSRETGNRGFDLIGRHEGTPDDPDIPDALEEAAREKLTEDEMRAVLYWAARRIRARQTAELAVVAEAAHAGPSENRKDKAAGDGPNS